MDRWQTFPIEFAGGLISNLSPLQQGANAPGSATVLRNFEPSTEGGYRRILGFEKWDAAQVTGGAATVRGVHEYQLYAIAAVGDGVYRSTGSGWTELTNSTSFPASTATADVNGAVSASTTLVVDNNAGTIKSGMVITGTGIVGTVTVASLSDQNNLVMSSSQTIADNASLTFTEISPNISGSEKVRFAKHHFGASKVLIILDQTSKPFKFDGTSFSLISTAPASLEGAQHVVEHKNHLFFAKDTTLTYTAPFSDSDFTAASGAGTIEFDNQITGLASFREQLIIFTKRTIFLLAGNSIADFALQPITRDIGAIFPDTVQEVGGDLMFLAPDGLRLLSGTERNNDFGLGVVSKVIQPEAVDFVLNSSSFTSLVIRGKSQYRILGYNPLYTNEAARGVVGVQFAQQGGQGMAWAETRGINAFVSSSEYVDDEEYIFFANTDGYVYRLESGNSFDGANIVATFNTPFMPITDPSTRKTLYKGTLFVDPQGAFTISATPRFDFGQEGVIQPGEIALTNSITPVYFYGVGAYGEATFGGSLKFVVETQLVGSGKVIQFQFVSDSTDPPFSLDALVIQYGQYGRR